MKKKVFAIIACVALVAAILCCAACTETEGKAYFERVAAYSFWDNKAEESIAQYKLYEIMDAYLADGTIDESGSVIGKNGKVKKVLFLGWDGVRADALTNIFFDENSFDTNLYNYEQDEFSGLHTLKERGGLYLAYSGGEKGTESEQTSSTCASWTSILTGGWNTLHGVVDNDDVKRAEADTIMLKYAKLGLDTGLAFDWGQLFDTTLQKEVSFLLENPSTPVRYRDIDRTKAASDADIVKNEDLSSEKDIRALDLDHYNAVAMDGEIHPYAGYDIGMRDHLLSRIAAGDDFVGGIFHRPDTNGHSAGFTNENAHYVNSVRNADVYLYQIIEEIDRREAEENEEWLIVVTTDHGGSGNDHGKQVYEHRTTWVACNKRIPAEYFGSGYDGFNESK